MFSRSSQLYNNLITASRFTVGGISWTNVLLPNPSSCPPRSSSGIDAGCIIQTITTACKTGVEGWRGKVVPPIHALNW